MYSQETGNMGPIPEIAIECAEITSYKADVIVLKFAGMLYGADLAIAGILWNLTEEDLEAIVRPPVGGYKLVETEQKLKTPHVLFVDVPPITNFSYDSIRDFSKNSLKILKETGLEISSIAVTIHGIGFGMDESECFLAQLGGFFDAFRLNLFPKSLKRITVVERDMRRVERLGQVLTKNIGGFSEGAKISQEEPLKFLLRFGSEQNQFGFQRSILPKNIEDAGLKSTCKQHIFVAMPFSDDFKDIFDYAIYNSISDNGYLCERVDYSSFTGSVMDYVLKKIKSSSLVVVELTGANANVYLELGYAWGVERPTILLAKEGEELKFDVKGQKVLMYKRIKELEEKLRNELANLKDNGILQ
jgi:hypothetical protein